MTMRLLNIVVIAVLIVAAAYVYHVKFDSTLQAERAAKLRNEIRRERETIAALRAEWARLDSPSRIQDLAKRHLPLKSVAPTQFESLDAVPMRAPVPEAQDQNDPIRAMIEDLEQRNVITGSVPAPAPVR